MTTRIQAWLGAALLALALTPALGAVPLPHIPEAKAENCVEDTAYMRRNHMELLKHQRDDTMRHGVRTTKYSLKGCLKCHAVKGEDNLPVSITSPKHFCNSCHGYAAVHVDCFECHASALTDDRL